MSKPGFLPFLLQSPASVVMLDANTCRWYTRGELAELVSCCAQALVFQKKALGFLFASNDAESLIAYLASIEAGNAVVMLDPDLDPSLKSNLIARFQPDFILAVNAGVGDCVDAELYEPAQLLHTGQCYWKARQPHRHLIHPDLTLLISTSGSTGSPKLVRLTWRNIESNARSINAVLLNSEADRAMVTTPIFNGYGQSVLHTNLISGGSFVLTHDRLVSREFWDTVRNSGCTTIGGTPYFYQVLDRLDLESLDLPLLKKFVQTGGRLSVDLVCKFHGIFSERGGVLHVMYGQAEATARITGVPPALLPGAARSIGCPLPDGRLSVENDGKLCHPKEEGELVYEGPNVMMGYATSPEEFGEDDCQQGRLKTGDIGYYDERGLFYITGRKARFVKLFGWRVSLDDVEEILSPIGAVAAVNENERIVIYYERRNTEMPSQIEALPAKLRVHPSGFESRAIDSIPHLPNGKTDYRSLSLQGSMA